MNDADPTGVRCVLMRGGTSKGAFFLPEDLPSDPASRDDLLRRIMGSPDPRQIDGIGGAHPLTSKVGVVSRSARDDAELDFLFLQIGVDDTTIGTAQTCGNLLAAVGPFAVERGLIEAAEGETEVRVHLVNTGAVASCRFATSGGAPVYSGSTRIDGVPGSGSAVHIEIGAGDRALLPTGNETDEIEGLPVTLVDNGMAVVVLDAAALGVAGDEDPAELESRAELRDTLERVRLAAGELFGLGDVTAQTVPKMILVSPPRQGGSLGTRAFIPHRVHEALGVLMGASVAAAALVPGTVAARYADVAEGAPVVLEHPSGVLSSAARVWRDDSNDWKAASLSLRTARKLFQGRVFPGPERTES